MVKQIIKTEKKYIATPHMVDKTYYQTNDGREFPTEEEAIYYERYNALQRKQFDSFMPNLGIWFYFEDKEQMKVVVTEKTIEEDPETFNNLSFPCWLLVESRTSSYDDDVDYQFVYSTQMIVDEANKIIDNIKNLH